MHACKCIVVLIGARCWQTRHGRVHSCLTAPLQEAGDFADVAYFVLKSRFGEVSFIVCVCVVVCECVCVALCLCVCVAVRILLTLPIPHSFLLM